MHMHSRTGTGLQGESFGPAARQNRHPRRGLSPAGERPCKSLKRRILRRNPQESRGRKGNTKAALRSIRANGPRKRRNDKLANQEILPVDKRTNFYADFRNGGTRAIGARLGQNPKSGPHNRRS